MGAGVDVRRGKERREPQTGDECVPSPCWHHLHFPALRRSSPGALGTQRATAETTGKMFSWRKEWGSCRGNAGPHGPNRRGERLPGDLLPPITHSFENHAISHL
jgi:hypothetical protein